MTMPDLTATSLVLEGGGFRGIYTSGVLDYFMEQGLYLPQVYGISAGALNALGYAAKQPGRTAQINFRFCHDKRYISVHNMIKYRCAFNLEFIFDTIPERYIPFDYSTFFSSPVQIHVGATNLLTGRCDFFGKDQMDKKLFPARASAALPLFFLHLLPQRRAVSRRRHRLSHTRLPVRSATATKKHVIILTRNASLSASQPTHMHLIRQVYRQYPNFIATEGKTPPHRPPPAQQLCAVEQNRTSLCPATQAAAHHQCHACRRAVSARTVHPGI